MMWVGAEAQARRHSLIPLRERVKLAWYVRDVRCRVFLCVVNIKARRRRANNPYNRVTPCHLKKRRCAKGVYICCAFGVFGYILRLMIFQRHCDGGYTSYRTATTTPIRFAGLRHVIYFWINMVMLIFGRAFKKLNQHLSMRLITAGNGGGEYIYAIKKWFQLLFFKHYVSHSTKQ